MFGNAVACEAVRVYRRRWWPLQPKHITMAPNGHLWFPPGSASYRDNFAMAPIALQAFFLHEITHVWQHQCGINLMLKRPPFARYRYLPLKPDKSFYRYGIEQQAEIVRHYWLLQHGETVHHAPDLAVYKALLPF